MTGPFPGQNPYGEPGGHSPWDQQQQVGDQFPNIGYGGLYGSPPPPPPRKRTGMIVLTVVLAVVVAGGAATAVWWFSSGSGTSSAAPSTSNPAPPPPKRTSTSNKGSSADAYDVGTCLTEGTGTNSRLELRPVQCGGGKDVLVINKVASKADACNTSADFQHHGYVLDDDYASVSYCLSLVVPVNQCFVFSHDNGSPIERTTCGSSADAVQVLAVESAPSASAACTDKSNPDVWFYQSPTSGQFACVSQTPSSSTNPSGPNSS